VPPSALAAIEVLQHHDRDEGDRKRREAEKPDEEEFERDEIHAMSLAGNDGGQPEAEADDAHHQQRPQDAGRHALGESL